jgi:hypothetical protein
MPETEDREPEQTTAPPPPPPPHVVPSVLPLIVHGGRRTRLGYVAGFGDDRYEVWDPVGGSPQRFPLTDEGWRAAWDAYLAHEAGTGDTAALREPLPAPRRRRRRRVAGVGTLLVVGLLAFSYLPLGSRTLLDDDFSDPTGWTVSSDAKGSMGYAGEAYRIAVTEERYELLSHLTWEEALEGIGFEADVRLMEGQGALSLLCISSLADTSGITPRDRYYDFYVVPSSGDYGILADGDSRPVGKGRRPGLVSADGVNRIRVECRAGDGRPPRLSLHVNGTLVLQRDDARGEAGDFHGVGLAVYNPDGSTVGLFDNARADEL